MFSLEGLFDTLVAGRNKVELRGQTHPGMVTKAEKTHVHASKVTRHWDGSYTATEAHTGATVELPRGSVRWIGPTVKVETEEL